MPELLGVAARCCPTRSAPTSRSWASASSSRILGHLAQVALAGRDRADHDLPRDAAVPARAADLLRASRRRPAPRSRRASLISPMGRLDERRPLAVAVAKEEATRARARLQARLAQLRLTLGGQIGERRDRPARPASCSRAGTRRARAVRSSASSRRLDPRHVRVCQFAAPTPDEKRHHFLWRFWATLPGWGGMADLRPHLVRAGAGRAGRGLRDPRAVAARLRRDQQPSSARSPTRA